MIRRLIEADIAQSPRKVPVRRSDFWLMECRTPEILLDLARRYRRRAMRLAAVRPALRAALHGREAAVRRCLEAEERREREADRRYWAPLRKELERWRLRRKSRS